MAFRFFCVSNSTISGNNITSNGVGIGLGSSLNSSSNYNSISENSITANHFDGIDLYVSSDYNSISENNITANYNDGIGLFSSSNSISGNDITANKRYGILLDFSSDYNSISENSITNNEEGIWLGNSSSDSIFHNNFINNNIQVYSAGNSANIWDNGYPSGGNYWSDYNGSDFHKGLYQNETGNDGIGDTPYVIDANNTDNYPLMSPYTHLVGDLNGDGKVGLDDLVLLANAYNSKHGDPNWNPLADIAPPYGIISLADLVTLAMHYGQHNP